MDRKLVTFSPWLSDQRRPQQKCTRFGCGVLKAHSSPSSESLIASVTTFLFASRALVHAMSPPGTSPRRTPPATAQIAAHPASRHKEKNIATEGSNTNVAPASVSASQFCVAPIHGEKEPTDSSPLVASSFVSPIRWLTLDKRYRRAVAITSGPTTPTCAGRTSTPNTVGFKDSILLVRCSAAHAKTSSGDLAPNVPRYFSTSGNSCFNQSSGTDALSWRSFTLISKASVACSDRTERSMGSSVRRRTLSVTVHLLPSPSLAPGAIVKPTTDGVKRVPFSWSHHFSIVLWSSSSTSGATSGTRNPRLLLVTASICSDSDWGLGASVWNLTGNAGNSALSAHRSLIRSSPWDDLAISLSNWSRMSGLGGLASGLISFRGTPSFPSLPRKDCNLRISP